MIDNQPIESKKYHAFISYRHADNKASGRQWATWLHHALETYEVPDDLVGKTNGRGEIIPSRIYPVFRDEQELPADADLGTSIKNALEESEILVALCSPCAVASTYVAEEIDYFKQLGRSDNIIAAIIDGEPNASWDTGKHKLGFSPSDECFPKPLQVKYDDNGQPTAKHAEPIAADFRINNDGKPEQGWTTSEAYKQHLKANTELDSKTIDKTVSEYQKQHQLMLLKIIAAILGVPLSDLTQRDKEYQLAQERQKAKRLRRWVSALVVLTILAFGAGGLAYLKQQEADIKTAEAQVQTVEANHNYALALNEKAIQAEKEGNIEYAKLYALHALKNANSKDKLGYSIYTLLEHGVLPNTVISIPVAEEWVTSVSFSPDSLYIAYGDSQGNINIYSTITGDLYRSFKTSDSVWSISFSPNGKKLATASFKALQEWDILNETSRIIKENPPMSSDSQLVYSPNNNYLAIGGGNLRATVWELKSNKEFNLKNTSNSNNISFSSDSRLIKSIQSGEVQTLDLLTGKMLNPVSFSNTTSPPYQHTRFYAEGKCFLEYGSEPYSFGGKFQGIKANGSDYIYLRGDDNVCFNQLIYGYAREIYNLKVSNNYKFIASPCEDKTCLWKLDRYETKSKPRIFPYHPYNRVMNFSPDSKLLAIAEKHSIKLITLEQSKTQEQLGLNNFLDNVNIDIGSLENIPNSQLLAIGIRFGGGYLVDKMTGMFIVNDQFLSQSKLPTEYLTSSYKGDCLVYGTEAYTVKKIFNKEPQPLYFWDILNNTEMYSKKNYSLNGVFFLGRNLIIAQDNELIEIATDCHNVVVQDIQKIEYDAIFPIKNNTSWVAMSKKNTVYLYDLTSRKVIRSKAFEDDDDVRTVTLSENGRYINIFLDRPIPDKSDYDRVSYLWNLDTDEVKQFPQFVYANFISNEGLFFDSGSESPNVKVINLKSNENILIPTYLEKDVKTSFSPDGNWLFLDSDNDGTLKVWNIADMIEFFNKDFVETSMRKYELQSGLKLKGLSIYPMKIANNSPTYHKTHPFHWLPLAEKGDANAMLQLGIIEHRDSHWEKAREWYQKALDAGNPDAEERLRILALTKQYEEGSVKSP